MSPWSLQMEEESNLCSYCSQGQMRLLYQFWPYPGLARVVGAVVGNAGILTSDNTLFWGGECRPQQES